MATDTAAGVADAEAAVDELVDGLLSDLPPASTPPEEFLGAQFDRGLAWVHYPKGRGGLGLSPTLHQRVLVALRDAGAPHPSLRNVIGYGMVAPTLLAHGTEGQLDRYLRPLFTGEEIWCQLFSEPGAGSDVASLATRAERDGDEWVLNGQKVWTTVAHLASFGLLLARTDPDVPKHAGITCFLVDMHAPGVDVRPLYQITGEAEFNEVFFTDVRMPDAARLGGAGEGWRVALTTLMNERVAIGGNVPARGAGPIAEALRLWHARWAGDRSPHALALRDRLVQRWVAHEVARLTNLRAVHNRRAGTPGPEGSVAKLAYAEDNKRTMELCVDLMGAEGMLYASDYPMLRPSEMTFSSLDVRRSFLRARANSIEGGTSEVMRNILGERVLGLPGEPRTDRDVPWKDVPRS
ncbi:MAG: acyl-CoA dehydrogenase family protein [Actinomycetota bacterium]|nr:acyl-CoA dehydrogenase family protein [Actinomycetota bacterium]